MTSRIFQPRGELIGSLIAGAFLLAGLIAHTWLRIPGPPFLYWASLAVGLVFGCKAAWDALSKKSFDIDVLMVVGAVLAAAIGHPGEGALLLFLFTLSGALEGLAMERTQREVRALHALVPEEALVLRAGDWVPVRAEELAPGDTVKVRPGERVPVDCTITVGSSSIDQSSVTGESMPREVAPGDELFAGTINTDDPLEATVLRPARESSIQKVLDLVTTAQSQREPIQRTIDKLSQPYSLAVFAIAIAVLFIWRFALGKPWLGTQGPDGETGAVMTAITLLIVASPCALVIATPTATLAAIARAARAGVLFKGGDSIDRLARAGALALDKTGTLTFGRPRLYEVHPVAWSDAPRLLAIAAALEEDSTHPIARAIRDAATSRGIAPVTLTDINHTTAQGLSGTIDGAPVRLGRWDFVEPIIPICLRARAKELLLKIHDRGHIGVIIARQDKDNPDAGEAAILIMADALRPGAQTLVKRLHDLQVRPVHMLTGDNAVTAQRVGTTLSLDAVHADLVPGDKLKAIENLRTSSGHPVAFIGDGVNDAPALAAADVSMAIGTIGTAAALESADIVLLSESLEPVVWSIRLARACRNCVRFNIALATTIIAVMGIATLVGSIIGRDIPLAIGVVAHEGGTVLVVLNSLRLLRFAK